jgi:hypothetical protein
LKKKKYLFAITLPVSLLLLVIIVFGILITCKHIEPVSDLKHLSGDIDTLEPGAVFIEEVNIYTQPDDSTCGIATLSTVVSYLKGEEIFPEELASKYDIPKKGGINYDRFLNYLSLELPEYEIKYSSELNDFELIKAIHQQLAEGIPVPVFFGSPNPYNQPFYDFHASVVTGINLEEKQVDIANVYGYKERISIVNFLNRMSYSEIDKYPFMQRIIIKLELIDTNSVFLIKKKS